MKTKVLYPASYPIDKYSNYLYLESPLPINHVSEASNLIKEFYVFAETELPIASNEIIRTNLKVYKKLDKIIIPLRNLRSSTKIEATAP